MFAGGEGGGGGGGGGREREVDRSGKRVRGDGVMMGVRVRRLR